jgi:2,3-bisphosphoglycerate-independent phosphoglycerate mutase
MARSPLLLIILDGFGDAPAGPHNAVTLAEPAFYNDLRETYPTTLLEASGAEVGLPCGLMGNSEVGHLNIGAGRIVFQEISRIDRSIEDGSFFQNPALTAAMDRARGTRLHLLGLVSDGGVHSSERHVQALLRMAAQRGLGRDQVILHAFLDGRDTPPRSARQFLTDVEDEMQSLGIGRIATVSGRYFAMDRDKRWDRVRRAYDAMTVGIGERSNSALAAVTSAYERGEGDEFVQPTVIGSPDRDRISDGDSVVYFNFRADRARQLTEAFLFEDFDGFPRSAWPRVHYTTLSRYRQDFPCPAAFEPANLKGIFPQIVSGAGLTQLRIAETEKYAHVTFFFSGGDERELPGERRILVPSPKVATYDLQPAMSAVPVTDKLLGCLDGSAPDVIVLNFANADMLGHTGVLEAAVEAIRTLDRCLSRIVPRVLELGGHVAITADHGNCEMMVDPDTGTPHTAHTTNPVPFILVGADLKGRSLKKGGRLCDISTTLLPILGLDPSPAMEGVNLL